MSRGGAGGGRSVVSPELPTVAIAGRPNVGKSTLVNRFVGRRDAIVEERPGVTRDRTVHVVDWARRRFAVVDTGGWMPTRERSSDLDDAVAAQAETAIAQADLVLLVVDATVGVTAEDAEIARWLRSGGGTVVVVANKVDTLGAALSTELSELYALGLGDPQPVSALHGRGSGDLLDHVVTMLDRAGAFARAARDGDAEEAPGVVLVGRPNVGKSSLFNRLLGQERTVVDDRPGTTRDAVDTVVALPDGTAYRFIDTAGLRRSARVRQAEATEYYSTVRTVQALDAASVALLILDVAEPVGEQEQKLARQILDAGRALVLVLNKWDLLDEYRREQLDREVDRKLSFVAFAPVVRTSARTGRGVDRLLPAIAAVHEQWRRRLRTAVLNQWLADAVTATPPPLHAGRPVRVRYITQVATGPPRFRVFTTGALPAGYVRYLERRLREAYGFAGTPLDVAVRVRPRWEERQS